MLVVKTKIKKSKIHGKGLFADENIKRGQIFWKFNPMIDKKFSQKRLLQLSSSVQKFIKYYSYLNDRNEFVLCGDGARYINHSDKPNTHDKTTFWDKLRGSEGVSIASKDIERGEEITSKYLHFDKSGKVRHI
jgi:hypothetical protein